MSTYRVYFIDADGHIAVALNFDCDDDETAIALVEAHRVERRYGHAMELWHQGRHVKDFPALETHYE